jgi:hypothetical protein
MMVRGMDFIPLTCILLIFAPLRLGGSALKNSGEFVEFVKNFGPSRPRGSHKRAKSTTVLDAATPLLFGAGRTELRPGRPRSP